MKDLPGKIEAHKELLVYLLKLVGYGGGETHLIQDYRSWVWDIQGDQFYHAETDEDIKKENYYIYEISSEGAKGEKLYWGQDPVKGIVCVMGYDESHGWDSAELVILEAENRREGMFEEVY